MLMGRLLRFFDLRLLQKKPGISREVLGSEHVWTESNSAQI